MQVMKVDAFMINPTSLHLLSFYKCPRSNLTLIQLLPNVSIKILKLMHYKIIKLEDHVRGLGRSNELEILHTGVSHLDHLIPTFSFI